MLPFLSFYAFLTVARHLSSTSESEKSEAFHVLCSEALFSYNFFTPLEFYAELYFSPLREYKLSHSDSNPLKISPTLTICFQLLKYD